MANKIKPNEFYELQIKVLQEKAINLQKKIDYQRQAELMRSAYENEMSWHDLECAKILIEEGLGIIENRPVNSIVKSYVESAKAFLGLDFEALNHQKHLSLSQQADELLRKVRREINANRNM